jgi:homoserine dehydrogenase
VKHRLAFIGFGTVGQGLAEILHENEKKLKEDHGFDYKVVAISDPVKGSVHDDNGLRLDEVLKLTREEGKITSYPDGEKGWDSLKTIEQSNANIIIEVTPTDLDTGEPGISHIRTALAAGKHVATTNKGPIALQYRELQSLAKANDVALRFEGTVMAGTPALNLGLEALAGAGVSKVSGILNGTTNFILTEMGKQRDYKNVLKEAQELGYAEADPTADVEGYDAVAKVVILANVLMDDNLKPSDVKRKGITGITLHDIEEAKRNGETWKLIGRVQKGEAEVSPQRLKNEDPLANVSGALNALCFKTDVLGDVTISGPGAGRKETGFALLSDILAIHRGTHYR